jgi:transcriptional regulator with XRE-family HTH domain
MTESTISRLEHGDHVHSLKTLCRIAGAFGRHLEIVFHEHEHVHAEGTRHVHPHSHYDPEHQHEVSTDALELLRGCVHPLVDEQVYGDASNRPNVVEKLTL